MLFPIWGIVVDNEGVKENQNDFSISLFFYFFFFSFFFFFRPRDIFINLIVIRQQFYKFFKRMMYVNNTTIQHSTKSYSFSYEYLFETVKKKSTHTCVLLRRVELSHTNQLADFFLYLYIIQVDNAKYIMSQFILFYLVHTFECMNQKYIRY